MTGMLASVTNVEEAMLALAAGVDIVDLKQPSSGALGALDAALVKEIVAAINDHCPVSATIGDLPMHPELIADAVNAMAETGVDYIKIGFFPGDDWQGTITTLGNLTQKNKALIAVLFADTVVDFTVMDALKSAGVKGVMLDTMNKKNGSLTQVMKKSVIADFVCQVKSRGLICGLAGSLKLADIPELLSFQPDYLGFRGALCLQHERTAKLHQDAVVQVRQAIHFEGRSLAV
ncbi:MAG: hypothetical protein HOP23_09565 [Methylococcaceae bacterium]|nr:hypothetical protein [Methylococcaceae bacterium]